MKKLLIAVAALLTMTACHSGDARKAKDAPAHDANAESTQPEAVGSAPGNTYFAAIDRYLVDSICPQYSEAPIHVPLPSIVAIDKSDANDIKVWGEFWVMNFNQVGDTLKMVSGGSHAGLMHIRQTGNAFEVTNFEQVGDGSLFEKTAKQIFGDKYDAFMAAYSDHEKRNRHHTDLLSEYAKRQGLSATMYQENGQSVVTLKK